jgi:hypothetical protein
MMVADTNFSGLDQNSIVLLIMDPRTAKPQLSIWYQINFQYPSSDLLGETPNVRYETYCLIK